MLYQDLTSEVQKSLKAGDSVRVNTYRFLLAAVQKTAIDAYGNEWHTRMTDGDVQTVIKKQVKTRRESIDAYQKAGRTDLVEKEQKELQLLQELLPQELTDETLQEILLPIAKSGEKNFGLLMKLAMAAVSGRADGARVSIILKKLIA